VSDSGEPDWIIEQAKARKQREILRQREDMQARLAKIRAKEKAQRDRYLKGDQKHKKRRTEVDASGVGGGDDDDDEQFVLDDYDSEVEQSGSRNGATASGLSAATLELMEKLGMSLNSPKEEEEDIEDEIKVS